MNYNTYIRLYYHPKEKRKTCTIQDLINTTSNIKNDNMCCYVAKNDNYIYKNTRYYSECYYFVYTNNDAIGCFHLCPSNKSLGYHKYDCEKVIVLYDYNKYLTNIFEGKYIYFAQHSSKQGQWLKWKDCNIDYVLDKPTLNIYVALGSHASYPKPKTTIRIFCFGNDNCSYNEKYSKFIMNYYDALDIQSPIRMEKVVKQVPEKEMTKLQKVCIPFTL
jgi:hypothetical protein